MIGFVEFTKPNTAARILVNVEEIECVTELTSNPNQTVLRMRSGEAEYVASSYAEVMQRLESLFDHPQNGDDLSIPQSWRSAMPRLQDGP